MYSDVETNVVAVERILEYTNTPTEVSDLIDVRYAPFKRTVQIIQAEWEAVANQKVPANWPAKGAIEFRNLELQYRPGLDLVLKKFSATIKSKEKVMCTHIQFKHLNKF